MQWGRRDSDTFKGKLLVLKPKVAGRERWLLSGNGVPYRKKREGSLRTESFLPKVFPVFEHQGQRALCSDKLRFLAVSTAIEQSIHPLLTWTSGRET